ncbi:hypothetical protein ACFC1B_29980 [Streptomyces xiamenensis]|uniref:hypothetical protein n=1 Tax=Streptomyces xiamenensis TaxID=408015 RepID=UPI0035D660A7
MPLPSAGPEIPKPMLSHPDMVAACRERNFAAIFKLVKRAGFYPSLIARRCDMTPSRVAEVMSGRRQLRDMNVIERVSDGLRIPGHMLGLAARSWETSPAIATPLTSVPVRGASWDPECDSVTPMLSSTDLDVVLATALGPCPRDSTLRALRSSIEDYWRRDDEHGGEALRPAVVGQLRYVESLIRNANVQEFRKRLHSIAAELARLTGWTYFDARQYRMARQYFMHALKLAQAIDDHEFVANVLASMSLLSTYQERPADAVTLAVAAQDSAARAGGAPRVLSMLSMREAFAHATLSDREATHAAINEAREQFSRISAGDPGPRWVAYFDHRKLTVDTGIALSRLGEVTVAEPLIADVLHEEQPGNPRGHAFHLFWLAMTQLHQGQVDQACHTAMGALEKATAIDSQRVIGHLHEFGQRLAQHRKSPAAMAFEAELRASLH